MDRLEAVPTSSRSAECTPIVLRLTGQVRLVFRPTLVRNDENPDACIKGDFVYQKKSSKQEWEPLNNLSLGTVKSGEAYKLELHSSELLALVQSLSPLYRATRAEGGPPRRRQEYVRLETGLARFLDLTEEELLTFLSAHPADAASVFTRLLRWLSGEASDAIAKVVAGLDSSQLPAVTALLGLATLKEADNLWHQNENLDDEQFWQGALSKRSFILSYLFAHPIVIIREKAFVGGKALDDKGGSYLDFLLAAASTGAVALVEIKTPATSILGPEYRTNVYPISREVSGAVAQVLKYRRTMLAEFSTLDRNNDYLAADPPCFVIAGNTKELNSSAKRESFESFRSQLSGVHLVTYDELFLRASVSIDILERGSQMG